MLLLLLSHFSRIRLCAAPWKAAHQAPPSLGFSRQEHWSGLPFPLLGVLCVLNVLFLHGTHALPLLHVLFVYLILFQSPPLEWKLHESLVYFFF